MNKTKQTSLDYLFDFFQVCRLLEKPDETYLHMDWARSTLFVRFVNYTREKP